MICHFISFRIYRSLDSFDFDQTTYRDVQNVPRLNRPTLRLRLGQQRQESKRREEVRSRVDPISIQPSLKGVRVHLLREPFGSLGAGGYVGVSLGYAVV
jgi:hypothetical protein